KPGDHRVLDLGFLRAGAPVGEADRGRREHGRGGRGRMRALPAGLAAGVEQGAAGEPAAGARQAVQPIPARQPGPALLAHRPELGAPTAEPGLAIGNTSHDGARLASSWHAATRPHLTAAAVPPATPGA